MLPPRILSLLVILLAVQGLCKPTKSTEDVEYEDDTPVDEDDEEAEEIEDDNLSTAADVQPQILTQRMSIRVKAGSTVVLPCQVMNAENYVVAWIKDNKMLYFEMEPQIEDSKRIVRLPNNSLVIYNASVNDSSNNYTCSILWQPHSVNLTHRLLVDPIWMHQQPMASPSPQHSHKGSIRVIPGRRVEVNQGVSLTLGCETDMLPPPEIKWFIENKKVVDDEVILKDNYITITKVNRSHSGLYQCLAEDGSEMPAMEAINVIVFYVPEIEVKRNVVYSGEGMESELTCIVSAHPEAVIKWFKDNKEVTHKRGSIVMHHGVMKNNKTKHVLKIIHTSRQDFGEYKCRAQNIIGQDIKSINLTGIPSQPRIFGAEMTSDDAGIILKWHLESYSPIKEYKLQYRRKGEDWNFVEPEVKDGKGNQFIVEHPIGELQPGSYEAVLMAKNAFGWSMPSAPHKFTGDYPSEMAQKDGNSAAIQIRGTLLALILVVLSCAFTSL